MLFLPKPQGAEKVAEAPHEKCRPLAKGVIGILKEQGFKATVKIY